ncbi:MAG TPA: sigma-54 dependent transcriptional regulator [Steroidobacteraceae bacterium]|nr:sigma-54 dependent transcriptional regulator [Steroidobacteraceae bacterium]
MRTVLVIDDNPAVKTALELLFGLHEIRTLAAVAPAEGLALLARETVDLVIADMNFSADTTSGEEGVELFRAIRAAHADLPVILLTGWTHLPAAVQLIKAGAADYIAKPWDNEKLLATVENLLELADSNRERARLQSARRQRRERLARRFELGAVVFESEAMEAAVELACRVARAPVPVLITGPNGAGKERIAAILHANSPAPGGPFVVINCGALPADLIEAELFGAEAGAFTGAQRARIGRFAAAEGGTLFLDEIGNLPLSGQVKLLRVLESGQYEPLGSSRTRTAHVRIVSATNADLPAMIREGRFREDLYYRLNLIEIAVPGLAERPEDIVPLAEHFLAMGAAGEPTAETARLSEEAREALLGHAWLGNVRELRNCIERAKLLAREGLIGAGDLGLPPPRGAEGAAGPDRPSGSAALAPEPREGDAVSREALEAALRDAGGNVSRAAQRLGLSRQALYRRLERFGLRL